MKLRGDCLKFLEISKNKNLTKNAFQSKIHIICLNRTYEVGLAEMSVREQAGLLGLLSPWLVVIFRANIEIINYQKDSRIARPW